MSAVKNLEALIKIENDLKSQYESKLDAKSAEIEKCVNKQQDLQSTIDGQKQKIIEMSSASADTKRTEQINRELTNRADKLQKEVDSQKKRIKSLQKEMGEDRTELKKLKQLDPEKMKKNLVANKKKLVEKTTANDLLQKSLNKTRSENTDFQREINELKEKLEELQPAEEAELETEAETKADTTSSEKEVEAKKEASSPEKEVETASAA